MVGERDQSDDHDSRLTVGRITIELVMALDPRELK